MQINSDNPIEPLRSPASFVKRKREYVLEPDEVDFFEMEQLRRALRESGDIRPDIVARARAQVEKTGYPPLEIIQRIGKLLAQRIEDVPAAKMDSNS